MNWPGEERTADRGVGEWGEVAHHHVQGLYGVVGDLTGAPFQGLLQRKQGHLRSSAVIKAYALIIKLDNCAFLTISWYCIYHTGTKVEEKKIMKKCSGSKSIRISYFLGWMDSDPDPGPDLPLPKKPNFLPWKKRRFVSVARVFYNLS